MEGRLYKTIKEETTDVNWKVNEPSNLPPTIKTGYSLGYWDVDPKRADGKTNKTGKSPIVETTYKQKYVAGPFHKNRLDTIYSNTPHFKTIPPKGNASKETKYKYLVDLEEKLSDEKINGGIYL